MFGLQENNDYLENAETLAGIIERYFVNRVSLVTPGIDSKKAYPWFCVKFVLYRTYRFVYEYERGYYSIFSANVDRSGLCILFNEENKEKFNGLNSDEPTVIENLKLLEYEVRLRLPDKFLIQFD